MKVLGLILISFSASFSFAKSTSEFERRENYREEQSRRSYARVSELRQACRIRQTTEFLKKDLGSNIRVTFNPNVSRGIARGEYKVNGGEAVCMEVTYIGEPRHLSCLNRKGDHVAGLSDREVESIYESCNKVGLTN